MSRLASGYRINKAADDAAGLAISEAIRGDIRSLAQARRNANDAGSGKDGIRCKRARRKNSTPKGGTYNRIEERWYHRLK